MHFTCRSFIGKPAVGDWSQYWENEPDDPQLKIQKGHLFGLINLSVPDGEDVATIGHDIIFEINQNYFSGDSNNPSFDLRNTIENITNNATYQKYYLSFTLINITDSKVFIANYGTNQVFISRDNKISQILNGQSNQSLFINGPINYEDKIFIITQEFLDKITKESLKNILADSKIQNIEENLLSLLYSFDDQKNLSGALIQTHSDDDIIPSDPIEKVEVSTNLTPPNPVFAENNPIEKPVFVNHHQIAETSRRKKIQITAALILILALSVSSYFGFQKNQKTKTENEYQSLKTEVEKQLNNISVVKSLNINTAQTNAKETQKLIQKMSDLKVHSDEVASLTNQINSILSQTGSGDTFSPDNFYDTSLIISSPKYNHLFLTGKTLYLLDSNQGRIDSLNVSEKSNKNVSISDKLKSAKKIVVEKDNIYVLTDQDISLVSKTDLVSRITFSDSEGVSSGTDFKLWNGSVYLLDGSANTIWKFNSNSSGFSASQNWLKNDAKINSNSVSLSIDGRVWVLDRSGGVSVYISGVKDNFRPNQNSQFNQTDSLTTSDSSDYLAFVDNQNLIYVYQKTGELVSKYNLNQLKIADIALDGANKTIYILGQDQKIYKINL